MGPRQGSPDVSAAHYFWMSEFLFKGEVISLLCQVIDAIAAAIRGTSGCSLLDVDPGASTNRTVYTFVGSPEAVVEGALNAAQQAFRLIDMSKHSGRRLSDLAAGVVEPQIADRCVCVTCSGEHPRTGALDVCPFIPVQNVSMDDCVNCANEFGQKLAELLHVPGERPR